MINHITTFEEHSADCNDEFKNRDRAFSRLTFDQVKTYKINIDVEGVEHDGQNMYRNTYLTNLRNILISLEPYEDVLEELDMMMARIYKRTRNWVEWTTMW
jgi:hypothetical protein